MTANGDGDTLAEVRAEIEGLHGFLQGWFSGALARSEAVFAAGLAEHLHPSFEIVNPAGTVRTREAVLELIRGGWGTNSRFQIEIHDVRLLDEWPASNLMLVEYVEAQSTAVISTPPTNVRRATALFERSDGRLLWRYLHETTITDE